jgi:hypothetical protein
MQQLATPIREEEYDWIQMIRAQYDSQFQIIALHFTFVFPCHLPNPEKLIHNVNMKTQGTKQISFRFGISA